MKIPRKKQPRSANEPTNTRPEPPTVRLKRKQRRVPEDSPPQAGHLHKPRVIHDADESGAVRSADKHLDAMSDEGLMDELACGNHGAFDVGSERWRPRLEAVAWHYLHRDLHVHDAAQQTLLKIYLSHIPHCPCCGAAADPVRGTQSEYRFCGSFNAWMYTILRHVIVDMRRKGLYIGTANVNDYDLADDREDVEHSILLAQVRQKCKALPQDEREALLARMDGKTLTELANEQHCAVSTMSDRVNAGIQHLRDVLGVEKK